MADFNEELIRDLQDSIRDLNSTIASAMSSSASSQRSFTRATTDATASVNMLSTKSKEAATQTGLLAAAASSTTTVLGQSLGKLNDAATKGVSSVLDFGKALISGTDNFQKFSYSINQGARALEKGFSAFGPLGRAAGLLLKPLALVAESALTLTDNLFIAKDELAKFGAVGAHTVEDIRQMGAASGYSGDQLLKYTKMMSSAGSGLIALGGNVNQGATEFSKLTAITKEERMAFQKRGISMDQFVEQTAEFVQLQVKSGRQISEKMKTDGTLQKMAKEYTSNLQIMAAITGENVEEIRKQQQAMANHRETVLADAMTQLEINRLRKSGLKADEEQAKKLESKLEAEKDLIKNVTLFMTKEMGDAIAYVAKTGIITEDALKISGKLGMTIPELLTRLAQGEKIGLEVSQNLVSGMERFAQTNGRAAILGKEYGDLMGFNIETLRRTILFSGKNLSQEVENAEKLAKKQETSTNKMEQARNDLTESTKAIKISFDNMVMKVAEEVTPKIGRIATSLASMVTEFEKNKFPEVWGTVKGMFDSAKGVFENLKGLFEKIKKEFGDFSEYLGLAATGLVVFTSSVLSGKDKGDGSGGLMGTILGGLAGAGIKWGSEKLAGLLGEESLVGRYISSAGKTAAVGAVAGGASGEGVIKGAVAGAAVGTGYQVGKDMGWWGGPKQEASAATANINDLFNFGGGTGSKENFEKLDPKFKNALINAAKDYNSATGDKLRINSAHRNEEENKSVGGAPNSRHLQGKAVDIQQHTDPRVDEIMARHGLKSRKDDHHYEMPGARLGGSFSGPNSGYPVMLHGCETVVPTPNPNTTLLKLEGESAANKITSALSGMNSDALQGIMEQMYQMMDDKLSDMVDKLSTSNDLQDKLLKVQM